MSGQARHSPADTASDGGRGGGAAVAGHEGRGGVAVGEAAATEHGGGEGGRGDDGWALRRLVGEEDVGSWRGPTCLP